MESSSDSHIQDLAQSSYIDYVKSHFPKISIVSYGPKAEDRIQL